MKYARTDAQIFAWLAILAVMAVLLVFFGIAIASAQQQTPEQQALGNKLMQEIGAGLQCQGALIAAQRELEELKKKHADEKPNVPSPAK